MTISAAIWKDPAWDAVALVERRRWRVQLSSGPARRMLTSTKRAAIEFCKDNDIPFVIVEV